MEKEVKLVKNEEIFVEKKDTCPICGGDNLVVQGRCSTCLDCGWSKCDV